MTEFKELEFKGDVNWICSTLGFDPKDTSIDQLLQAGQISATLHVAETLSTRIVNMVAFNTRALEEIANRLNDIDNRLKDK